MTQAPFLGGGRRATNGCGKPHKVALRLGELRCPATKEPLSRADQSLVSESGRQYPIVEGVPVLIAEERSLFDPHAVAAQITRARLESASKGSKRSLEQLLARIAQLPPTRSRNVASKDNYELLARLLRELGGSSQTMPRVLVIGGRVLGAGMSNLAEDGSISLVETDVAVGPRTELICDAHDLPFEDGSFQGVVIQAVLESVIDPERVASEVHRVLCPGGLVYSEAPFIQQVHEGAFDFNRFTHLGHRKLWRWFDEVRSGAQCGPGMAMLWSAEHFLQAFAGKLRVLRALIRRVVTLLGFWIKYFDDFLVRSPAGIDAASGTFFLGRRRTSPLSDREVVAAFRGVPPAGG